MARASPDMLSYRILTRRFDLRLGTLLAALLMLGGIAHAAPLDDLATLKDFKAERSSSADLNWQNGNGDARPIPPGGTLTLAQLSGPGRIAHIWFTIADNEKFYGKKPVFRSRSR